MAGVAGRGCGGRRRLGPRGGAFGPAGPGLPRATRGPDPGSCPIQAEAETGMRALVYHGPGRKAWEEVPKPEVIADPDAIVRVDSLTICGTDQIGRASCR